MKRVSFLPILLALAAAALVPLPVGAQTAEQLEIFRSLTPEQQRAVMQGLGSAAGDGVQRDRDIAMPETVRPRTVNGADPRTSGALLSSDFAPLPPRIQGHDTVLLDVRLREADAGRGAVRLPEDLARLEETRDRLLRGNPYRLDTTGGLRLSGVPLIRLAGLDETEANERLRLEPGLRDFEVRLRLLPLERVGVEALRPFGYDLFAGAPSTFAPVTDVPVPAEYVVGPGDRLEVQLIGNTRARHSLVVNRDGRVMFPDLGPIPVSGIRFEEARERIEARVAEQMIGTQAVVTMGDLRSIRVFVLGEAERPGSYTVSGLATIGNALFASGGVKTIGSLRNIQLKRAGVVVQRLDLYDLLLAGDNSADARLLPGDVIFIPPVGSTVGVVGEIRRPALYELNGPGVASDLLYLGGGLTPEGDPRLARIERIDERGRRIVVDLDLTTPQGRSTALRTGDVLHIPAIRPTFTNTVEVRGHLHRPGAHQFRSGLRLTDVLPSAEELRPNADLHYVLVRREEPVSRRIEVFSADLAVAWRAPDTAANPLLQPRDQVFVFDLEAGRGEILEPILAQLRLQAAGGEPNRVIRAAGQVRSPGEYPLEPGMTVGDLVRAAGGLAEQAFRADAELARYEVRDGRVRRAEVLAVELDRAMAGDAVADIALRPHDTLVVKQISEWTQQEFVQVEGEVRFPGYYPITRGESLRSVIERAGGLTSLAYAKASVFTRESLQERERQQLEALTERMRQDLGTSALRAAQASGEAASQAADTLAVGQALLADLQRARPVGRLVIDLERALAAAPGATDDLSLRGGDRLRVPKQPQEVTVLGEVPNATSHLYRPGLTRDDYLRLSGGPTRKADKGRIYVVRADGSVETGAGSRWFRSSGAVIQPGDTIVVPLDTERISPLPFWTAVTTILYNIAVAVAAVNSF